MDDTMPGKLVKKFEALSVAKTLFTDLNVAIILAQRGRFVASKCFVIGKDSFWSFGTNFTKIISEYVEDEVEAATLRLHESTENSHDKQILEAFGGKEAIEITLGQLFYLLRNKRFKDGKVYFAYIKGLDVAVIFYWISGFGWYVFAYPITYQRTCYAGSVLVARDSGS